MKSSYLKKDLTYGDIISSLVLAKKSEKIVEFGILDGYSLLNFIENSNKKTKIEAYDIFEDFNGNCSQRDIIKKFEDKENVKIEYGDFYKKYKDFNNESIDILHIDIANNGEVYKFVVENYLEKINKDGIIILEGGSEERDEVEWMKKFNKPPIKPFINSLNLKFKTFGEFPSITVIFKD
tara:strand:- start:672 stop:1211 length:540 start_codon:yes stop_codon:yes gene_type:complete